mgnify:CR=1 FL=1
MGFANELLCPIQGLLPLWGLNHDYPDTVMVLLQISSYWVQFKGCIEFGPNQARYSFYGHVQNKVYLKLELMI